MRMDVVIITSLLLGSILTPIAIGALRGTGSNEQADENEIVTFAESYYFQIIDDFEDYKRRREKFSGNGTHLFGRKISNYSECKGKMNQIPEDDIMFAAALSHQRSTVLKNIFDQPAIDAIEDLPAPLIGALNGCRYTVMGAACDAWTGGKIFRANRKGMAVLERERQEWLRKHDAARCKAAAELGVTTRKCILRC